MTPDQIARLLALVEDLARERGDRVTAETRPADYDTGYKDGETDAREDVSDRCADLLREIRGYV